MLCYLKFQAGAIATKLLTPRKPAPSVLGRHNKVVMAAHTEPVAEAPDDRLASGGQAGASSAQKLSRAKAYPYARPACSFVFVRGEAWLFEDQAWPGIENLLSLSVRVPSSAEASVAQVLAGTGIDSADLREWTPVLGIGSNGSPQQLSRKYPVAAFPHAVIPTVRCALQDFDVTYAPLISSYGSVTATLEHSPGTCVEVCMTYLTPPLLEQMHKTEGAYSVVRLHGISLAIGATPESIRQGVPPAETASEVLVYIASNGTLAAPISPEQSPVAIKEVPATGRRLRALSQTEMQLAVKAWLQRNDDSAAASSTSEASDQELDAWIASNLNNKEQRFAYVEKLAGHARPFGYQQCEQMQTLGDMLSDSVE